MEARPFLLPRRTPLGVMEHVAEWATGLKRLDSLYCQRPRGLDTQAFLRHTLEALGIDYRVVRGETGAIPDEGPLLIVANHPLGGVEGVILAELLLSVRSDVKVMANHYLRRIPELRELFIGVDVFAEGGATNFKAIREADHHLRDGGALLVFPAGEVSAIDMRSRTITDKAWGRTIGRLARRNKATALPIFVDGQNSRPFYLAGLISPILRTLMLGRELLNKKNHSIGLALGECIAPKELKNLPDDQAITDYLRLNTYLLGTERDTTPLAVSQGLAPVIEPVDKALLCRDIAALDDEHHLLTSGEFEVYCAPTARLPAMMREIGRIREISFRAVGEGTGNAVDIDGFDSHYLQLFVWNSEQQHLVGAYRLGLVDKLYANQGVDGLYSRTLFNYDKPFIDGLGKAIEMGRSVVSEPYQRSLNALLLLWKGIATYVHRNPEYTSLFGPVSISNDYSPLARQLMAATLSIHHYHGQASQLVTPSNPLKPANKPFWNPDMLSGLADIQVLSRLISRMEGGIGLPVLLRQYLGLNGRLVCFNVDPDFNDALDGLIWVDLRNVPQRVLARYMGKPEAQAYLASHQSVENKE